MADDRLTERKEAILQAVVEEYMATARPVGSGLVTEQAQLKVSSATVRKELGALEEDGFLHQPHTSGRGASPPTRAIATSSTHSWDHRASTRR